MPRALLLFVAALGSLAVAGARADADSVGTLQVKGTFKTTFSPVICPPGTPETTNCYPTASVGTAAVPGLGKMTTAYTLFYDDFGSACGHVHAQIPILVAGKGEIDLAARSPGCLAPNEVVPLTEVTVSGGSGKTASETRLPPAPSRPPRLTEAGDGDVRDAEVVVVTTDAHGARLRDRRAADTAIRHGRQ